MPTSFPAELLLITNGTATFDLMNRVTAGFWCYNWVPAVAEPKGGGSFRDSPLAEGRTPAYRQLGNVIDTFDISATGLTQDVLARDIGKLRYLLESAVKYWVSNQPSKYVWLVARGVGETNTRYATIIDYRTPSDGNPYDDPWAKLISPRSAIDPWSLTIEHDQWGEKPPGIGTCVEVSAYQNDWNPYADWLLSTAGPVTNVNAMMNATGPSDYVFGGDTGQIWRSPILGVWANVALAHANCLIYSMEQAVGVVYASGYDSGGATGYTYSSADGAAWATYGGGINRGTNARDALFFAADGYLYLATGSTLAAPRPLLRTIPGSDIWATAISSTQWAEVLCSAEFPATSDVAPNRMVLSVYDTLGNGTLYISDDYWTTSTKVFELPGVRFISMFVNALDFIVAGTDTGAVYSSADGITWEVRAASLLGNVYGFARDRSSGDLCCVAGGRVWISGDEGMTWLYDDTVQSGHATIYSIATLERGAAGYIFVGRAGDIYNDGYKRDLGVAPKSATCDDKNFVVNHRSELNLTNIIVHDSGTSYTEYMRATVWVWPIHLLPAAPAANDGCYFGIDTAMQTNGDPPFDNIVFNISTPSYDIPLEWQYWNGVWTTLVVQDGTDAGGGPFTRGGINNVSWVPPDDWVTTTVNGTTALWVRCFVTAAPGGAATEPEQQIPLPYSCIWPKVEVAADQVPGTIMALGQHLMTMRSDEDGLSGDAPDLWANRVIMGLRKMERGGVDCSDFTAYLNCSDEQNPPGIACSLGASMAFVDYLDHAPGRTAEYYPLGVQPMAMRVRFELAGELARQYHGSYHAFLRVRQVNALFGTVTLQLYIGSPWGSDEYWSRVKTISGPDEYNKLIDLGPVDMPQARLLKPDEYPGTTRLEIHAACTDVTTGVTKTLAEWMASDILAPYDTGIEGGVNPTDFEHWTTAQLWYDGITGIAESPILYFLDLILMPTDEWYGNFTDNVLSSTTALKNGYYFDLDGIENPREKLRPLVFSAATGAQMASYEPQSPGPVLLNPQEQQRMWYLFDKSNTSGTATWDASSHILLSTRIERMARYLGMRGDR